MLALELNNLTPKRLGHKLGYMHNFNLALDLV
jgi:hypothetical protein